MHRKDATSTLIELEQPEFIRMRKIDKIYASKLPHVVDFVFDEKVAEAFPDMIRRSVPGYETIIALLGIIAKHHAQPNSNIYDLGCSLGAAMLSIQSQITDRSIHFIGVDDSLPMLQQCQKNLSSIIAPARFSLLHDDICKVEVKNAGMVILNFTLQFLAPTDRLSLLRKIYANLKTGGVVVLSEKVAIAKTGGGLQQLHDRFKLANGYSDLEIAQKRVALENVMVVDSASTHLDRLHQAGFPRVTQWFQAFNFCSFIAYK